MFHGAGDVRIDEMPIPVPGQGQVLLAVRRNGLCGSDLHTYVGSDTGGAAMHLPGVVLGHEFAGTVAAVGPGVADVAEGTAVAVAPIEWCGECHPCRHGWVNLCRRTAIYGGYRLPLHGGLAPFVAVSRRSLHPVPDGLDLAHAALAEPVAVAVHAVRRAPVVLGASVLVLGAGPIGLAVLQAAHAAGAGMVAVTELSPARQAAAARLGADVVLDPTSMSPARVVREQTGGGADVVFDTTASHAALAEGLSAARARGTVVSVAGWQEPARVDMGLAMAKEIDLRFVMTYEPAVDFPVALSLLTSGAVDASAMVSDEIALADVVELGLEELRHHSDRHLKILVNPSQ